MKKNIRILNPRSLILLFALALTPSLFGQQVTKLEYPFENPLYDIALPQLLIVSGPSQTGDIQEWGSPQSQTLATGDGHTTTFAPTFSNHPVVRNSIVIRVAGVQTPIIDDGHGVLFGLGLTSGAVNYTSGVTSLTFANAPANLAAITAVYAQVNAWVDASGTFHAGGLVSGTVTSFSAGTLSPLFTTSVATATTTPALSFNQSNAAAGTLFGNNTGAAAHPGFTAAPVLGVDGTTDGTLQLANSGAAAHTIWASGATTTNTIAGFPVVPVTGDLASCTSAGTICTLTDSGVLAANVTLIGTISTQTANPYVVLPTDGTVLYNTSGGVVTLPSASIKVGQKFVIENIQAGSAVTINAACGACINGDPVGANQVADQLWTQWSRATYQWDGAAYWIIAR